MVHKRTYTKCWGGEKFNLEKIKDVEISMLREAYHLLSNDNQESIHILSISTELFKRHKKY